MEHFVREVGSNPVYCWHAEPSFWKRALQRHPEFKCDIQWVDVCQIFKNEPIVIRGCMNFSLKEVVRACKSQGLINVQEPATFYDGGLNAMVQAWNAYETKSSLDVVVEYNKFDCTCLREILKFVRTLN